MSDFDNNYHSFKEGYHDGLRGKFPSDNDFHYKSGYMEGYTDNERIMKDAAKNGTPVHHRSGRGLSGIGVIIVTFVTLVIITLFFSITGQDPSDANGTVLTIVFILLDSLNCAIVDSLLSK